MLVRIVNRSLIDVDFILLNDYFYKKMDVLRFCQSIIAKDILILFNIFLLKKFAAPFACYILITILHILKKYHSFHQTENIL